MIRLFSDVKGTIVRASDGDIGKIIDYYFDDQSWAIRYLVVDVGTLVFGGFALISPISVSDTDWKGHRISLSIDRDRVASSPTTDILRPISRQYEAEYYHYYGYPLYWTGPGIWGAQATPEALIAATPPVTAGGAATPEAAENLVADSQAGGKMEDSRLRSAKEVAGYHIRATDREVGHLDDYLLDPQTWVIESIVIDTSNWPGGKSVVLAREQIERVDWASRRILVNMTSDEVRNNPEFSESTVSRRM
jgi:hypothetical protein